ncbi:unnamed protein product, partial [Polarella glacialis]
MSDTHEMYYFYFYFNNNSNSNNNTNSNSDSNSNSNSNNNNNKSSSSSNTGASLDCSSLTPRPPNVYVAGSSQYNKPFTNNQDATSSCCLLSFPLFFLFVSILFTVGWLNS